MSRELKKEYIPFPINHLTVNLKSPVDLYIKLSKNKYILLVKKGSKTKPSEISNYKEKNIDYFWILKGDFANMSKHSVIIAGIAVDKKNISLKNKVHFISSAANLIFKELNHIGFTQEGFEKVQEITEATIALTKQNKNLNNLLNSLNKLSDDLVKHALAVSSLSVLIGTQLGWTNKGTDRKSVV